MGVPKFFRYISERYPCLSEVVNESEIPVFDNLYLDMNGIIHNCSHPNDFDPSFRITEEKIFKDIFHYIEVLFRIIRPQKLFFMAVDGVAPRAKMNQQRGRRFRSAKEAHDRERAVLAQGGSLPETERFDSNCITPGTIFMTRLQEQLKYFVTYKVSTDELWQKVKIILSGQQVPGEGEHKIMDYIRFLRSQDDYDPSTRHCLYGLDADLIMLGLCTHEPHFSLLREEVKFGRQNQSKKIVSPESATFYLLHLSLMREYLEMEFQDLKPKLEFGFNLESIIDDWILMGFLVGNDFIPHLPCLHISSGALPLLYKIYMEVLPTLDGYINEKGKLNLPRFHKYMKKLSSFEIEHFKEVYGDKKYFEAKRRNGGNDDDSSSITMRSDYSYEEDMEALEESDDEEEEEEQMEYSQETYDMLKLFDDGDEDSDGWLNADERQQQKLKMYDEFCNYKVKYYKEKLQYENVTEEVLKEQAECYIEAIQWNLHYYYDGVCSWSWFYPHHYAPCISDIKNFEDFKFNFKLDKPFSPFQQLLAVLPALSKSLLPLPFWKLMTNPDSEICDYYPTDFSTDLNGKKQDWEAVVLIPFIDQERLMAAMKTCYSQLTDEEKERDKHGPMHIYTYTKNDLGFYRAPDYFPSLTSNHAKVQTMTIQDIAVKPEKLKKGLLPGALSDVYYKGFPTFRHLQYRSSLQVKRVKVFQSPSQNSNMIVEIINNSKKTPLLEEVAPQLLDKTVYVSWPYLLEAKVRSVYNTKKGYMYLPGDDNRTVLDMESTKEDFERDVEHIENELLIKKGIDIGKTELLVSVSRLQGQRYVYGPGNQVSVEKVWYPDTTTHALQTVVKDIAVRDGYKRYNTIEDLFPIDSKCFLLHPTYYGDESTVTASIDTTVNGNIRVKVKVTHQPEPDIAHWGLLHIRTPYYQAVDLAPTLNISVHLLSRITGCVFILDKTMPEGSQKVDVGLNLKYSKRNEEVPGYTKRTGTNQWLYSSKVLQILQDYMDLFPEVFRALNCNLYNDIYPKDEIFPQSEGTSDRLQNLKEWLNNLPSSKIPRKQCGSEALDPEAVCVLERRVDKFLSECRTLHPTLSARPNFLYKPTASAQRVIPDRSTQFHVLDRVVNVRSSYTVPLGLRGTIIGIQNGGEGSETLYEVLFDKVFTGGQKIHCSQYRIYSVPGGSLLNITQHREEKPVPSARKNKQIPVKMEVPAMTAIEERKQVSEQQQQQRVPTARMENTSTTIKNMSKVRAEVHSDNTSDMSEALKEVLKISKKEPKINVDVNAVPGFANLMRYYQSKGRKSPLFEVTRVSGTLTYSAKILPPDISTPVYAIGDTPEAALENAASNVRNKITLKEGTTGQQPALSPVNVPFAMPFAAQPPFVPRLRGIQTKPEFYPQPVMYSPMSGSAFQINMYSAGACPPSGHQWNLDVNNSLTQSPYGVTPTLQQASPLMPTPGPVLPPPMTHSPQPQYTAESIQLSQQNRLTQAFSASVNFTPGSAAPTYRSENSFLGAPVFPPVMSDETIQNTIRPPKRRVAARFAAPPDAQNGTR